MTKQEMSDLEHWFIITPRGRLWHYVAVADRRPAQYLPSACRAAMDNGYLYGGNELGRTTIRSLEPHELPVRCKPCERVAVRDRYGRKP